MLISERLAKELGVADPLGFKVYSREGFYEVAGVIQDIFCSYNAGIPPLTAIVCDPSRAANVAVRLPPHDAPGAMARIERTWRQVFPQDRIQLRLLSEDIDQGLSEYRKMGTFYLCLTVFSIVIACLGVFGLAAFSAERRTREIGIRKVLGATAANIIRLMAKEFFALVGVAWAATAPLALIFISGFLQSFQYRVAIGPAPFFGSGLLLFAIVWLTIALQVIRAARRNPVDSLRYE